MRTGPYRLLCVLALLASSACSSSPTSPTTPSGTSATSDADLASCVTTTNQLRGSVGLPPLTRSSAIESYAALAASADAASGLAHSYSIAHNGGATSGLWGENELLKAGLTSSGGTIHAAIQLALNLFWSEGPSGAHYQNIVGPYSQMGCGVFVDGPQVTVVEDFRS